MSQQRLRDLQEILDLLYEKLGAFQRELVITASPEQQFALKQRIRREIAPSIRRYEAEYWDLLPEAELVMPEAEAASAVVEIQNAVTVVEQGNFSAYPPEMMQLLREIKERLDAPDTAASAKLKVALPIVPMLASYELEMDTESTLTQLWRSLRNRLQR
jgi:hypothetical protein